MAGWGGTGAMSMPAANGVLTVKVVPGTAGAGPVGEKDGYFDADAPRGGARRAPAGGGPDENGRGEV